MDWITPFREFSGIVFPILERLPILRATIAFLLVFFLPGWAWSLVFFRQINIIERMVLSLGLSIVAVTLSLFFANRLFGIGINGFNSALVIIAVTILPLSAYYLNKLIKRSREIE